MNAVVVLRVSRLCAALWLGLSSFAVFGQTYGIRALSASGEQYSYATAINGRGEVVGTSRRNGKWEMFAWLPDPNYGQGSGRHSIYSPPADGGGDDAPVDPFGPYAVNDSGVIVGEYFWTLGAEEHWDAGRFPLFFGPPRSLGVGWAASASDINNVGQIVGYPRFLIWPGGAREDLGFMPDAINESGVIVGRSDAGAHPSGYMRDGGVDRTLEQVLGVSGLVPTAINGQGEIVGYEDAVGHVAGFGRAFLYLPQAAYGLVSGVHFLTDSQEDCRATAINELGQVLIWRLIDLNEQEYLLWQNGVSRHITNVVAAPLGWSDLVLTGINDSGHICGYGTADGFDQAILMRPLLRTVLTVSTNFVSAGDTFEVIMRMSNRSVVPITGVRPSGPLVAFPNDLVEWVSGPTPSPPLAMGVDQAVLLTNVFRATNSGVVRFTGQWEALSDTGALWESIQAISPEVSIGVRADLLMKLESAPAGEYLGNDLYQRRPAAPQIQSADVRAGEEIAYLVQVQNESESERAFPLRLMESTYEGWEVSYRRGTEDITVALRTGNYSTAVLPSGAAEILTLRISSVTNEFPSPWTALLRVQDQADDSAPLDVGQFTVRLTAGLVVNVVSDAEDADPEDGILDVDLDAEGAQVSLRAALRHANSAERPGRDTITFDIPGGDLPVIAVQSALPEVIESLSLDGTSQPGGYVRLDGLLAGASDAVRVLSTNTAVRGLMITRFQGTGIAVDGGVDVEIAGNIIGTDLNGATGLGNREGIRIANSAAVVVGGLTDSLRNIVSMSLSNGVTVVNSSNTVVGANFIGTDPDGVVNLPNGGFGIVAEGDVDTRIGDDDAPVVVGGGGLGGMWGNKSIGLQLNRLLIGLNLEGADIGGMVSGLLATETTNLTVGGAWLGLPGQSQGGQPRVVMSGVISNAVHLFRTRGTHIFGTAIGTDLTGSVGRTNGGFGIVAEGDVDTRIGDDDAPVVVGGGGLGGMWGNKSVGLQLNRLLIGLNLEGADIGGMVSGLLATETTNLTVGGTWLGLPGQTQSGLPRVVVSGMSSNAMHLLRTRGTHIFGTAIGTDLTGSVGRTNGGFGIVAEGDVDTRIGDDDAPVVLIGNGKGGVSFRGSLGGLIGRLMAGVSRDGVLSFPNGGPNLSLINTTNTVVGGPFGQSVFSGSRTNSVEILNSVNVLLQNSRIGTDVSGQIPIPNAGTGIFIGSNSMNITIGGPSIAGGNVIRNNGQHGVQISGVLSNVVVQNTVSTSNTFKAIDRLFNGLRFPAITNSFRGSTHVEGSIRGQPNETLRLEFFGHRPKPGGGQGEGELLLGSATVTLDGGGFGGYNVVFSRSLPTGWYVAATTTDDIYGTSEFSPGREVLAATDTDGDGMPDFWENLHDAAGLNPLVFDPPEDDFDGDGFTDLQEYLAGTDPERADSSLRVDGLVTGNPVQIGFKAVAGRQYGLDRSTDLVAWTRVATSLPDDSGEATLTDPAPPPFAAHYRLVAEFP